MTCPRCELKGHQIYTVEGELGKFIFDVEKARRIAFDGHHRAFEVPPDMLQMMLLVNEEHCVEHIDHVDPMRPGILAQRWGGIALIDGNHRARRCLRDQLPFRAFMLDLKESMDCMIQQEQKDLSPELIARELRGMLNNNPQCEMMTVEFSSDENAAASETAVRCLLTDDENARITIHFLDKDHPHFCCRICGSVSYNSNDIAQGYCGQCHAFTGEHC